MSLMMTKRHLTVCAFAFLLSLSVPAQQNEPVVVQPGAPGQPTRVLAKDTNAVLPPVTKKDIEFMQGMIMHHQQAVDMVALFETRVESNDLRSFGIRISQSQAAEIEFMKRWLTQRGQKTSMKMDMGMDMDMPDHKHHQMLMPGMLSDKQMKELAAARGAEFDRLFLEGMIQHHGGALIMVDDLFKSAGAGQDAELFTFATDVDSTQRAEIKIMQEMLGK